MAKKKKKNVKPSSETWRVVKAYVVSPQFAKLRGAVYVLFAVFLAMALASAFLTQFVPDSNWLGVLGFKLSAFFADKLFGIASLGIAFLFFIYGFRLWDRELLPWWKTMWCTLFWMVWLSTLLGYIDGKWVRTFNFDHYAGVGLTFAGLLDHAIKRFTLVLLAFVAVAFLVMVHKVKIDLPQRDPELLEEKRRQRELMRLEKEQQKAAEKAEKERLKAEAAAMKTITADAESDDEAAGQENDMLALEALKEKQKELNKTPKKSENREVEFRISGVEDTTAEEEVEPPVAEEPTKAEKAVEFNIDDEFERINRRARGEQDAAEDVAFHIAEQPETPALPTADNGVVAEFDENGEPLSDDDYRRHYGLDEPFDPHLELKDFQMPSIDMLEDWEVKNTKVTKDELVANKDKIVATLRNYGIEIVEISASPGPTVTLYEIKPAPGIRISKIKSLEDDIALSLSALGIRIIAPIPGRGTIGIEVPNTNPQIVAMKTMLSSDAFMNNTKFELPVALGKTISNEPYVTDLAKMPHLLMAGATGTGKSVGLNAVIASLLFKKHPSELKFVMVDPKKVELSLYSKIERHYLAKLPDSEDAIITDVKKVVRTLNSLCIEMDTRYDLLKLAQVRKITEYNAKFCQRRLNPENGHRYLPYIVLVIDEFADLIMTAGKEVETPIARLAQLARAVGIHLIIATQRPTTNIITGTIKANFPARIAFRVTSGIDSRTILDTGGANQLIGRGDMLISLAGADMVRIQCALIETEEIEKLAEFIGQQRGYPEGFLLPEYLDENDEPTKDFDPKQKDEFFNDAARLVVASQFGSTSLLQRKLSLGYNRAGRIIDQLEAAGIVGPYNGSKARDVLIKDEVELEEILRNL